MQKDTLEFELDDGEHAPLNIRVTPLQGGVPVGFLPGQGHTRSRTYSLEHVSTERDGFTVTAHYRRSR